MTDLDLERLGDVWRQQPDPAELEELKRTAGEVGRSARWGQTVDIVASILVAFVILFLVLSNPKAETSLVGSAAILILLTSQIRSRRLRQSELRALTGTTEQMLDQSIERLEATMKRTRLQLLLLPPGFGIGLLIAALVNDSSGAELFSRLIPPREYQWLLVLAGGLVVAAGATWLARSTRRTRSELARVRAIRDAWRSEQERDLAGKS